MRWKAACLVAVLAAAAVVPFRIADDLFQKDITDKAGGREAGRVEEADRTIRLLFAGDVMFARGIARTVEKSGGDYGFMFSKLGNLVSEADLAFANLETSVSTRGTNVGSIYSFRSDPTSLDALKAAGFDAVSVANNHIWDWGKIAFLDTLAHLDDRGVSHAGGGRDYDEAHRGVILERNGIKVGFLAYTNLLPRFLLQASSSPAVAFPTVAALRGDISAIKARGADIVITSFHWGEEYVRQHNASQEYLAKAAVDAGALIVMGHHSHTPQEVERYKGGLIIYSLGNLVFDQNFDEFTKKGLMVEVVVENAHVASFQPIDIQFAEDYRPFRVSGNSQSMAEKGI